jgi:hypothetical protein
MPIAGRPVSKTTKQWSCATQIRCWSRGLCGFGVVLPHRVRGLGASTRVDVAAVPDSFRLKVVFPVPFASTTVAAAP